MQRFVTGFLKLFIICLALAAAVCGCAGTGQAKDDNQQPGTGAVQDGTQQPDAVQEKGYGSVLAAYGVSAPVSSPGIYVDVAGYVAGREKRAVFIGECQGGQFHIVRSKDGVEVYTGIIPKSMQDVDGRQLSVADFTALDEPGDYYIYTDIVGQSYPFRIAVDTYENMFLDTLRNVLDANMQENAQGVCDTCFGMHVIMHAMISNGALFETAYSHLGDDEQDRQLVTQLLYVAKKLISQQQADGSLYDDYGATAAFCGIMAMSRDMFGRYEENVDKEYRQAADNAWNWLQKQKCSTDGQKSARFYAAAQLFHESGSESYKKTAEEFLREKKEDYSGGRFVFYGVLAYISSEKGSDRDLCTYIMKDLMEKTEQICAEVEKDVIFGVGDRTVEGNLQNLLHLSFVNYLTPNKEYTVIIENIVQYMGGLNETGTCYMGADGIWKNTEAAKGRSLEWNGIMLLSMGDMLRNFSEAATGED